jgi:hypothetical protein
MGAHINEFGRFQSDKYPTVPSGKVPLSISDPTAQDLLWEYAKRRRVVDAEFSDDLERCLVKEGYTPTSSMPLLASIWSVAFGAGSLHFEAQPGGQPVSLMLALLAILFAVWAWRDQVKIRERVARAKKS